jgi:D-sedoheptulose 7-phosphate isomerase
MTNIDSFYTLDSKEFATRYISYLGEILRGIDPISITKFIEILKEARIRGSAIYFIGNGGSAATASHFANDLSVGVVPQGAPFRASSLTDNMPVITAIANDYGYEDIFMRQLQTLGKPGDVLVGISASGNSLNVIKAMEYALSVDIKTVAITAFNGGKMIEIADASIHVPTPLKEYGPAEDAHMILDHLVAAYLIRYFKNA